uniref:DnaJ (Hsp40) homolog, subfamily C, member 4 n=1 Tax=Eptatretus burgeri TaxID=7764 RepID=A0A8C4NGA5_EPTBU
MLDLARGPLAWLCVCRTSVNVSNRRLHSRPQTHYEVLGVPVHASKEEIKEAFFKLSKKLHPDRDPNNPALHAQFVQLNEAHSVLGHIKRRHLYDLNFKDLNAFPSSPHRTSETWTTRVHVWKDKTSTNSEQKLQEVNQRYILEQNKEAHQFYMETQQRFREHGLEGQLAILRKRHREFSARHKAYHQNQDP